MSTQAQHNLNVGGSNTPVRNVTLKRIDNVTRLVIRSDGGRDIHTKSSPDRYAFRIVSKSATTESHGPDSNTNRSFNGRKISLDLQGVDIRTTS